MGMNFAHIDVVQLFIAFSVLVFSLTVHESAHAWAADRLGDPTARLLGRVSLNPVVHVDPIGTILFPLAGMISGAPLIGWAKPVPVAVWRFERGRRDYLMVAAAGPISNLAVAFVAAVALRLLPSVVGQPADAGALAAAAGAIAWEALRINLLLAVFNLLPIPPLDGSSVLAGVLPESAAASLDRLRPYGFILLYALLLTPAFGIVVVTPYRYLLSWLL
jgi:Zn-dependent protease